MARKTQRTQAYNPTNANSYVVAEAFTDAQDEEVGAGVIIRNNSLQYFGNETQASLSRLYPDGVDSGASRSETSDYFHILNSVNPFNSGACGVGAQETIALCQQCFYNFPSFRNPIIMQSYLANSPLHFTGQNKKIVTFYQKWAKKCKLWEFANEFFLEWWRSGSIFAYKFEGELKLSDIKSMSKASDEAVARNRKIPLKYSILNPADIRGLGSSSFSDQLYGKVLNAYEVEMLKQAKTDHDKAIFKNLDEEAKRAIQNGQSPVVKLDPERLRTAFNAKQAYEPMAVPPYFGVLKSINFKQILRSAEEKVAASADYCILFITAGDPNKKEGENRKLLEAMANLFSAQSVGRVLFAHYSAKAAFIVPDLNKIFGNAKYENVDQDIINGMNDIMASEESFATGQTKTKIYLQLLWQARESFLNFFLIPEMEKIAEEMGFDEVPEVNFEEVTLESLNEGKKLYNRLYELGALTPDELFHAYNTNQLPSPQSSMESQKTFKTQKKAGVYEPLIGGDKDEAGRPGGTKAPKSKNTISPKKGKASLEKAKALYGKMSSLAEKVQTLYKEKNAIARLSQKHKGFTDAILEKVIVCSAPENWEESAASLVANPLSFNTESEQYQEIELLAEEHQIGILSAAILFHSFENN